VPAPRRRSASPPPRVRPPAAARRALGVLTAARAPLQMTVEQLLREETLRAALVGGGAGGGAGGALALEEALQAALAAEGTPEAAPAFDPARDVPVLWGAAAGAARAAAAEAPPRPPASLSTPTFANAPPPPGRDSAQRAAAAAAAAAALPPLPRAGAPRAPVALQPGEELCGVGMALRLGTRALYGTFTTKRRQVIEVDGVLPGGSAHASGRIQEGDVLLSVRNDGDTVGMAVGSKLDAAKAAILGAPGSVVVLKLMRGDSSGGLRKHHQERSSYDVALVRVPGVIPADARRAPSPPHPAVGAMPGAAGALPEQRAVEPGDEVLLVEGVPLDEIEQHDLEGIFSGEDGEIVEVIVQKPRGELYAVPLPKQARLRSFEELWVLLHPPGVPAHAHAPAAPAARPRAPATEQRLLGSRTLARVAGAGIGLTSLQHRVRSRHAAAPSAPAATPPRQCCACKL